jgi:hypothetical protein
LGCEFNALALLKTEWVLGDDLGSDWGTIESLHGICGSMFWPGAV